MNIARLLLDIKELATWIEANGNSGFYVRDCPIEYRYALHSSHKRYRDGILFYSRGHGWRVRKKPHWKTIYDARVAQWYKAP